MGDRTTTLQEGVVLAETGQDLTQQPTVSTEEKAMKAMKRQDIYIIMV